MAGSDQAGLIREAVLTLTRLNPWLADIITVQRNRIVVTAPGHPGEGGFIEISSSDVGSSYGQTPHLVICDEIRGRRSTCVSVWKCPRSGNGG